MLDFAILGLPRSGTTWAANWLTAEKSHCIHDPLNNLFVKDLESLSLDGKMVGVSCTGLWRLRDWCLHNIKRIIVIDRNIADINKSLSEIGLPIIDYQDFIEFSELPFKRINFSDLFNEEKAKEIWRFLIGDGFDSDRHKLLCEMNIQPAFNRINPNPEIVGDYVKRLQGVMQ